MDIKSLKAAYQKCVADMQSIIDNAEDILTEEQQSQFDALKEKAEKLKAQISNVEKLQKVKAEEQRLVNAPSPAMSRQVETDVATIDPNEGPTVKQDAIVIPAKARRWAGNLECFKGKDAEVRAYRAGMWLAATLCKNIRAKLFCKQHGMPTDLIDLDDMQVEALHQEGVNTQGGYLVPDEYETDIIRLVEAYGLARRKMKITPMTRDTLIRPRRTGGLTAYFVGEGEQITESTGSWDNVKLIVKKLAAIAVASNELIGDAIINVADELTREIALAFATKEDVCAFQGDGTSTYGGIVGIVQKLSTLNGVDDGGGLVLAADNVFSGITNANLVKMIGQVPNYPGLRPEWYCSKPFWNQVMVRLIMAAGGATMAEFEGMRRMQYGGYPVNWTSGTTAMPVSDANSQIACLFGDMRMAAMFGDRAGLTIAVSNSATVGSSSMFDTDSFAVRGIERFDINVHDVGTASAAGPVVGLITAAS